LGEYEVTLLLPPDFKTRGKLLARKDKLVFEPDQYAEKIEIPVNKIKDVRYATEKDISALRVWLVGPVLGTFWKEKHRILLIDFEDDQGIVQHLTFEGHEDIREAERELYDIRKAKKTEGQSNPQLEDRLSLIKKLKQKRFWSCPRCLRQNAMKAKICTRCGFERPENGAN